MEDNHEVLAVSISEFTKYAEHVIDSIQKGKGTFEIPLVEPFLKKINITKIKQNSDSKKDIVFKIHDDFTGGLGHGGTPPPITKIVCSMDT